MYGDSSMQLTNAVIFFKIVNFRFKIDGSKENMKGIFLISFYSGS